MPRLRNVRNRTSSEPKTAIHAAALRQYAILQRTQNIQLASSSAIAQNRIKTFIFSIPIQAISLPLFNLKISEGPQKQQIRNLAQP
jgi:hypothetical protein